MKKEIGLLEIALTVAGLLVLNKVMRAKVGIVMNTQKPLESSPEILPLVQAPKGTGQISTSSLLKTGQGYNSGVIFNADGSKSFVTKSGEAFPVIQQDILPVYSNSPISTNTPMLTNEVNSGGNYGGSSTTETIIRERYIQPEYTSTYFDTVY